MSPTPVQGRSWRVRGTVQGVGFRPTVWRLAHECALDGDVRNDGDGVLIRAWGASIALDRFGHRVATEAPALARIDSIDAALLGDATCVDGFQIVGSNAGAVHTAVVADAAPCAACLADVDDPTNRRYRYAFTNCTHCGPRLSIVERVPYDRAATTMHHFAMCAACRAEYADPANRRFHAQPIACADCGPRLWLEDPQGAIVDRDPAACLDTARQALLAGSIVAIKGLGGFHLACNALDGGAVARLRARKRRPAKPLALMARDVAMVRRYCHVDATEAALLESNTAPIVLLAASSGGEQLAAAVAPGLQLLGVMLPSTPLHHLLLANVTTPLVFTSGNVSDEPPCTANDDARRRLAAVADLLLLHDRDIAHRIDDSITRVVDGVPRVLRRARGHAPAPLTLPPGFEHAADVLALGAQAKNTFCLVKDGAAIVSPHIGDLESARAQADYRHSLALFEAMFEHRPEGIAVDAHPQYVSTQFGRDLAAQRDLPLITVQHHHAHLAACLVDNRRPRSAPPVLGIVLDGLGFGSDGTLWGGEFLFGDYTRCERLAHLKPVPMIGAAQAVREPWRSAYAHLRSAGLEPGEALRAKPLAALDAMLAARLNSPLASSCGRLFDAVAASLGICFDRVAYEGQAAIELEALAAQATDDDDAAYPFALVDGELDPAPMWQQLLGDLAAGTSRACIARRFHHGLALAIVETAIGLRRQFDTVALSGGVFQNALLLNAVQSGLSAHGFIVLTARNVPPNDGGISLGQAAIAAAMQLQAATADDGETPCA